MIRAVLRVWQRNWAVYRRNWKIGFLTPLLEPLMYLTAFGMGLNAMVGQVIYHGRELSYLLFIAPALLAINIMNNAFFENTYGSYVRMYYQKTFDAMMATPLTLGEIITGEIIWGATKSVMATAVMMAVLTAFGLIAYPWGFLLIPLAVLGGFAFGSIAMVFTSVVTHIDLFNLPFFLFITPMFLFSGTFFPVDNLPLWARYLAWVLPLSHLVDLSRDICYGRWHTGITVDLLYYALLTAVMYPLALRGMRRRLIIK